MVSFNAVDTKVLHFVESVYNLAAIDDSSYLPHSLTPLFDAMGSSILKLKQYLEGNENYSVLVTILTDGEENASKEFSSFTIKSLVEELKKQKWTFTYIGAEHDIENLAFKISIDNTLTFAKNELEIKRMFSNEFNRSIYMNFIYVFCK
jgi:hypothetical protein